MAKFSVTLIRPNSYEEYNIHYSDMDALEQQHLTSEHSMRMSRECNKTPSFVVVVGVEDTPPTVRTYSIEKPNIVVTRLNSIGAK